MWDDVGRDIIRNPSGRLLGIFLIDQHRLDLVVTGKQSFDQRAAFGDESTAPSRQVATAEVQVGLEARVVQAVDLKLAQLRIPVFVAYRALRSRKKLLDRQHELASQCAGFLNGALLLQSMRFGCLGQVHDAIDLS